MKIKLMFKWYDIWIGLYVDRENRALYFCPLPMIVIKFYREAGAAGRGGE